MSEKHNYHPGEQVIATKPKDVRKWPAWPPEMDDCDGATITITGLLTNGDGYIRAIHADSPSGRAWTFATAWIRHQDPAIAAKVADELKAAQEKIPAGLSKKGLAFYDFFLTNKDSFDGRRLGILLLMEVVSGDKGKLRPLLPEFK